MRTVIGSMHREIAQRQWHVTMKTAPVAIALTFPSLHCMPRQDVWLFGHAREKIAP